MEDIAVSVKNVSKKFRIPINGKKETLQERFVNPFHKTKYVEFHTLNNLSFDVKKNAFSVSVIPETFRATTVKFYKNGSKVNLEFDIIGKYIERQLKAKNGEIK